MLQKHTSLSPPELWFSQSNGDTMQTQPHTSHPHCPQPSPLEPVYHTRPTETPWLHGLPFNPALTSMAWHVAANLPAPQQPSPSASCPLAQACPSPSAIPEESYRLQDLGLDLPAAPSGLLLCPWREDCSPRSTDDDLPEFPQVFK